MTIIKTECPKCGKITEIEVDKEKYDLFQAGQILAEEAFPNLEPEIREMLISGICPKCWDELFEDNEES